MKVVRATVDSVWLTRPASSLEMPQGVCLDEGYDYGEVCRTLAVRGRGGGKGGGRKRAMVGGVWS